MRKTFSGTKGRKTTWKGDCKLLMAQLALFTDVRTGYRTFGKKLVEHGKGKEYNIENKFS